MVAVARPDSERAGERSAAELTDEICRLHTRMVAIQAELLRVVAEYERRQLFEIDAAHSMGDWLTLAVGVSTSTGRDWSRTATALTGLPEVSGAFADGDLSYDQVRVLARFVTAEDDGDWAQQGPKYSVAELARIARQTTPVTAQESQDTHARRRLDWVWDTESRSVKLFGVLPEDDGKTVVNALERIIDATRQLDTDGRVPYRARLADALVELAGTHNAADANPERATVVIAVDAKTLTGDRDTGAWIETGPAIAADTARRLACDSRYQTIAFDEGGLAIGVGRMQRSVPPAIRRVITARDITCRWPGCHRNRRLHCHHIIHWANGGRTDTDNLTALCPHHHRTLHEGHHHITGNANHTLTFEHPDGTPIGNTRPPSHGP
jgi:hypothetical protein